MMEPDIEFTFINYILINGSYIVTMTGEGQERSYLSVD